MRLDRPKRWTPGARGVTALVALSLLVAGCTSGPEETAAGPSPSASPTPTAPTTPEASPTVTETPQPTTAEARIGPVPPAQWEAMVEAGMVRPECPVQDRGALRRVDINHYGFDGDVRRGHLIVHRDTAGTTARIFTRLFDLEFPIRRMVGTEAYGGDVNASLRANNTSAYNCRRPGQINAPFIDSPHANGRAVDVNPVQNPWRDLRCDCWSPSGRFAARTPGPGKILEGDRVWRAFVDEGWIWQNIDVADYMHFDTGYPSRPYRQGRS